MTRCRSPNASFWHLPRRHAVGVVVLLALLLRALLPQGYMPVHADAGGYGLKLVFCSAGNSAADPAVPAATRDHTECVYALAALPPLPAATIAALLLPATRPLFARAVERLDVVATASRRPPVRGPPRFTADRA